MDTWIDLEVLCGHLDRHSGCMTFLRTLHVLLSEWHFWIVFWLWDVKHNS